MASTTEEVRNRAATDLGILKLNGTLNDQDKVRIDKAYDEVYAELKREGIATWTSTANVPNEFVPHIAAMMADNCLGTYGVSTERFGRVKDKAVVARREVRKLGEPAYVSMTDAQDY